MGYAHYMAGTLVVVTGTFAVPSATPGPPVPTDPTTVTLTWALAGQVPTTWTWPGSAKITHVSTGVFSAEIDTTGMQAREVTYEWAGLGVQAVGATGFRVIEAPF